MWQYVPLTTSEISNVVLTLPLSVKGTLRTSARKFVFTDRKHWGWWQGWGDWQPDCWDRSSHLPAPGRSSTRCCHLVSKHLWDTSRSKRNLRTVKLSLLLCCVNIRWGRGIMCWINGYINHTSELFGTCIWMDVTQIKLAIYWFKKLKVCSINSIQITVFSPYFGSFHINTCRDDSHSYILHRGWQWALCLRQITFVILKTHFEERHYWAGKKWLSG